jgi:hypothetical protein
VGWLMALVCGFGFPTVLPDSNDLPDYIHSTMRSTKIITYISNIDYSVASLYPVQPVPITEQIHL